MVTRTVAESLHSLFDYLDGLTKRATVRELAAQLRALDISVDDVRDYVRFGEADYLRNLVREGPHYHALVLCWRSRQRSPIHSHAGSTCGLRILKGIATETVFETTQSLLIKPVSSKDRHAGDVSASQDGYIHQVSNLQRVGQDLVTLHVYSPPLLRADTYSLTDPAIGEFRPMVLEDALGSGI